MMGSSSLPRFATFAFCKTVFHNKHVSLELFTNNKIVAKSSPWRWEATNRRPCRNNAVAMTKIDLVRRLQVPIPVPTSEISVKYIYLLIFCYFQDNWTCVRCIIELYSFICERLNLCSINKGWQTLKKDSWKSKMSLKCCFLETLWTGWLFVQFIWQEELSAHQQKLHSKSLKTQP